MSYICKYCGKELASSRALGGHISCCSYNPNSINNKIIRIKPEKVKSTYNDIRDDLFCKYCNKQYSTLNSLYQHEIRCKSNPNRYGISDKSDWYDNLSEDAKSRMKWNAGLTKDTDERVAAAADNLSKYYKVHGGTFTGKHHSDDTKKKMSEAQKKVNHADNNRNSYGKKGWYDGLFFMSTYELAYYIYIRDNYPDKNIEKCKDRFEYFYEGSNHFYTPDFKVDGEYIEIKGRETKKDIEKYKVVDNLNVLYYTDIYPMISYVKNKYNIELLQDLYDKAD